RRIDADDKNHGVCLLGHFDGLGVEVLAGGIGRRAIFRGLCPRELEQRFGAVIREQIDGNARRCRRGAKGSSSAAAAESAPKATTKSETSTAWRRSGRACRPCGRIVIGWKGCCRIARRRGGGGWSAPSACRRRRVRVVDVDLIGAVFLQMDHVA